MNDIPAADETLNAKTLGPQAREGTFTPWLYIEEALFQGPFSAFWTSLHGRDVTIGRKYNSSEWWICDMQNPEDCVLPTEHGPFETWQHAYATLRLLK